jgi:hypothetical protein
MNAYELADELLRDNTQLTVKAAYMLRQQADRIGVLEANHKIQVNINEKALQYIAELESCLDFALQDTMDYLRLNNLGGENNHWIVWARKLLANTTPQTKPLSDEEIEEAIKTSTVKLSELEAYDYCYPQKYRLDEKMFARAIEERHGIK